MRTEPPLRLKGRLVLLRPFAAADITPAYLSWLNDPVTMRFSNQRFRSHTKATSSAYLNTFVGSPNLFLSVRSLAGDGVGTMTAYHSEPHGTADIGILIGERQIWGRGHGLDAWRTLMDWLLGEGQLRKVTAGALSCNLPMLRVMEKSGMHHEGSRRLQEIVDGVPHDILLFARFRDG